MTAEIVDCSSSQAYESYCLRLSEYPWTVGGFESAHSAERAAQQRGATITEDTPQGWKDQHSHGCWWEERRRYRREMAQARKKQAAGRHAEGVAEQGVGASG